MLVNNTQEGTNMAATAGKNEPQATPVGGDPIDAVIANVKRLYQTVTGNSPPPDRATAFAPIPPEVDPETHVAQRMDQLLSVLGVQPATQSRLPLGAFPPPLALWETDKEIVVSIELAGIARDRVEVAVTDDLLVVTGHRPTPWTNGDANARVIACERAFGPLRRVVALPRGVQADKLSAACKDGVLEIRIARPVEATPPKKTIPVT